MNFHRFIQCIRASFYRFTNLLKIIDDQCGEYRILPITIVVQIFANLSPKNIIMRFPRGTSAARTFPPILHFGTKFVICIFWCYLCFALHWFRKIIEFVFLLIGVKSEMRLSHRKMHKHDLHIFWNSNERHAYTHNTSIHPHRRLNTTRSLSQNAYHTKHIYNCNPYAVLERLLPSAVCVWILYRTVEHVYGGIGAFPSQNIYNLPSSYESISEYIQAKNMNGHYGSKVGLV
jgi:hypothetical protein